MSRISERFKALRAKGATGLVTYVTAGDPDLDRSAGIVKRLDRAGGERSSVRREAEQHRAIAMSAEGEQLAANGGQGEVGRHSSGRHAGSAHRALDVLNQVLAVEAVEVVGPGCSA